MRIPRPASPPLQEYARTYADPDVYAALSVETLATKPMPTTWKVNQQLGFEVRVRPVVRTDKEGNRNRSQERDIFLSVIEEHEDRVRVSRETTYVQWLAEQFNRSGAATLIVDNVDKRGASLRAYQRSRVARRDKDRRILEIEGPDAVLQGKLEVLDSDRFSQLLRRGVGRHRAFGYGMVLLRPVRC